MTLLQRIHYVWLRVGLFLLVAMPVAALLTFRAQGLPADTFIDTDQVRVTSDDSAWRFMPAAGSDARIIILPGCPVEARAYAPLARQLALAGIGALVVKTPLRCAPLPSHQAALRGSVGELLASCGSCRWFLAGHSRGAVHALEMAAVMADRLAGLLLLGTTHPRERDFARLALPMIKMAASRDGVATLEASRQNRHLLPTSLQWREIDGGNHSQFAYYGFQLFDRRATISREEQHRQIVRYAQAFVGAPTPP